MRRPLLLAMLVLAPVLANAQTFKCKQADGKVSFQDHSCPADAPGSQIVVRPTAPSSNAAEIARMRAATSRATRSPDTQANASRDANKAHNHQVDAYNKSVQCENARHNLGVLKSYSPVFRYDNKGEKQYIEDSHRQSEMTAAERSVASNCN